MSASLLNQPVMSLRTGTPIGTAVEPIINPNNLKILGWWCHTKISSDHLVLLADDIRDFMAEGFAVNDEDALAYLVSYTGTARYWTLSFSC